MAHLRVPGSRPSATPLISGRATNTGLSKDTRNWIQRVEDELAIPCPGCGVNPVPAVRVSFTCSVATCRCGARIGFHVSVPATRVESPADKRRALALRMKLKEITTLKGRR